ncbi:MAG: hypothetical protein ACJ8AW_18635 [Rhodopila sp.]|jgi:hypothetical protein
MQIKTASWFSQLPPGHVMVGISRSVSHQPAPGYRMYRRLAPGPCFNSLKTEEYCRRYQALLDQFAPYRTVKALQALARGGIPVMVCYEQAGSGQWCHRALVASWIAAATGLPVPEVGYEHLPQDQHPLLPPLRRGIAA